MLRRVSSESPAVSYTISASSNPGSHPLNNEPVDVSARPNGSLKFNPVGPCVAADTRADLGRVEGFVIGLIGVLVLLQLKRHGVLGVDISVSTTAVTDLQEIRPGLLQGNCIFEIRFLSSGSSIGQLKKRQAARANQFNFWLDVGDGHAQFEA